MRRPALVEPSPLITLMIHQSSGKHSPESIRMAAEHSGRVRIAARCNLRRFIRPSRRRIALDMGVKFWR